jgi:GxxExxY protein
LAGEPGRQPPCDAAAVVGFRVDLLVGGSVVVEVKSLVALVAVHRKQILRYLRLSGRRFGFLLNFGAALRKDGIVRVANGLRRQTGTVGSTA